MGKPNLSDEFRRDAVAQITERGYPVAEVSQRLGVSPHSLYPSNLTETRTGIGSTAFGDCRIRRCWTCNGKAGLFLESAPWDRSHV